MIEQGFDFDTSFQLEDTRTNSNFDLTDASVSGQLRKHYSSSTAVFLITVTSADLEFFNQSNRHTIIILETW